MNALAVLRHLLAAVEHARGACDKVRAMVRAAIARYLAREALERYGVAA